MDDFRPYPSNPHASLLVNDGDVEGDSGWMISYVDIMTLLVALLVIIIVAANATSPDKTVAPQPSVLPAIIASPPAFEVPLPPVLAQEKVRRATLEPPDRNRSRLMPEAISAALGVSGLPAHHPPTPPALLARPTRPSAREAQLPRLALADALSADPLISPPYMLVLTYHLPTNARDISDQAVAGANALAESLDGALDDALTLPDLGGVEISTVPGGIRLRMQVELLFPSATAELSQPGQALVAGLVDTLSQYEGKVLVEGHTDDQPISTARFSSNWALSSARAIAIVEALERAGVARERLRAVGYADTRPLTDNDTPQARERNRRVEVVVEVQSVGQ